MAFYGVTPSLFSFFGHIGIVYADSISLILPTARAATSFKSLPPVLMGFDFLEKLRKQWMDSATFSASSFVNGIHVAPKLLITR